MRYSKQRLLLLPAFAFCVVAACTSTDVAPPPVSTVTLTQRGSARLAGDVTVVADSIFDSRCPKDVVCVRAGEARVKGRLLIGSSAFPFDLSLTRTSGLNRTDSTAIDFALIFSPHGTKDSRSIVLRDVTPYPTVQTDIPNAKSEAVLEVRELYR